MKTQYETVPMGGLCSISSGESDTQDAVTDGPYAFFDRSKTIKRSNRYLYDCEALIIPGEGKEFLPRHYEGKFDLHQRAYALSSFSPKLNVRYLFHYLHHRADYFPSVAVGTTVKSLRRRHFENLPVPVPPLTEQQRIVGMLDEAFAGIATLKANAERNVRSARAIFDSHLQSVFNQRGPGWVEKRLSEIATVKGGKRVPKGYKLSTEPTGYPYLRVADFADNGTIDMSDIMYVTAEVHRSIKNYVITSADLYISIAGTIGKSGIIPEALDGANLTENACRLVLNSAAYNRFVYFFTMTPDFVRQAGMNTSDLSPENRSAA